MKTFPKILPLNKPLYRTGRNKNIKTDKGNKKCKRPKTSRVIRIITSRGNLVEPSMNFRENPGRSLTNTTCFVIVSNFSEGSTEINEPPTTMYKPCISTDDDFVELKVTDNVAPTRSTTCPTTTATTRWPPSSTTAATGYCDCSDGWRQSSRRPPPVQETRTTSTTATTTTTTTTSRATSAIKKCNSNSSGKCADEHGGKDASERGNSIRRTSVIIREEDSRNKMIPPKGQVREDDLMIREMDQQEIVKSPMMMIPGADGDTTSIDLDHIVLARNALITPSHLAQQDITSASKNNPNLSQYTQHNLGRDGDDQRRQQDNHQQPQPRLTTTTGVVSANSASVGVQTAALAPYRLRFWPICCCRNSDTIRNNGGTVLVSSLTVTELGVCADGDGSSSRWRQVKEIGKCCVRTFSQWFLSQLGLTLVLVVWAVLGAYAFYETEGPRERDQSIELKRVQHDLSIELSTDLRQVVENLESWPPTIERYFAKYEELLLEAVSAGFGEGGGGNIWTYPGCILFAVSLLTTLGFGAPVPRTSLARGAAVLFAAIGIPLHFLLIINIGNMAAGSLTSRATSSHHSHKKFNTTTTTSVPTITQQMEPPPPNNNTLDLDLDNSDSSKSRSLWFRWFPLLAVIAYYTLGVSAFGVARGRSLVDSLMFPLDFTAAGGVGNTAGYVRVLYAIYLEGAVTLAAVIVSLLQASATRGVIDMGLRLGLLTNN